MSTELWAAIIGGVAGLLTGAVSALVAPWAKWHVDKKRIRHEQRTAALALWRNGLANYRQFGIDLPGAGWYQQLRPHLSIEAISAAERPRIPTMSTGEHKAQVDGIALTLTEEVDRIEREWELNR